MLKKIGHVLNVSGDECIEVFLPPSLETLEVRHCSELGELPLLPPRLMSLQIEEVGLTKLPRIHNGNAEAVSSQLQHISVVYCQSLTSLEGSLFEQKQYMGVLRDLYIINCIQLEFAPLSFEEMNELEAIDIKKCPKLRTLRDAEDKILPSSLRRLMMEHCGDLELPLLGSLQGLTNLTWLMLKNCSAVESLPSTDVFQSLRWLQGMLLTGCGNLSSLGGLGSLSYLYQLQIRKCSKLAEAGLSLTRDASSGEEGHPVVSSNSLQINSLVIDLPSMLHVEPLNSLRRTKFLSIEDGSEMQSIPERWLLQNRTSLRSLYMEEAKSLESLPPSMRDLSSLEKLNILGAGQLRSFADLPSSLKELCIQGCHSELEERFREFGIHERNKISHVRQVQIGDSYFIMGKKCSREAYYKLRSADDNTISSWLNEPEDNGKGVESALKGWRNLCFLESTS